jgi:cellulose synthase/poly-beta-1,6-N-acetylglucosamine synthase-like glycosyltransferase
LSLGDSDLDYSSAIEEKEAFSSDNSSSDPDPEKQAEERQSTRTKGHIHRIYHWFRAAYWPLHDPPLVLPTPPTDVEKFSYLHTNRIPLYIVGVFAFLSLSAGMWLFSICSYQFYWFSVFTFFLQLYLVISYWVGVVGSDFDYDGHKEILNSKCITKENAPSIDIYLPVCLEPLELLRNTWRYVQALEYPGKLEVHVLDDGNQETVKNLAAKLGFNYIVRDDRPRLRKAGNLRWAFARTFGDYFVIFDADFCPRSDFLLELLPEHLADPNISIVQTPQYFRVTDDQTWVEKGAGAVQELFYRVVQVNRNKWGASICVGSNAMYRRSAFEEVGGTAEIGFSEDVHTGLVNIHTLIESIADQ